MLAQSGYIFICAMILTFSILTERTTQVDIFRKEQRKEQHKLIFFDGEKKENVPAKRVAIIGGGMGAPRGSRPSPAGLP